MSWQSNTFFSIKEVDLGLWAILLRQASKQLSSFRSEEFLILPICVIRYPRSLSRWNSHRCLVNCWHQMMADSWFAVYLFLFLFSYSSEDVTDCPGEISFILFSFEFRFSFENRVHHSKIYKAENFVASVGGFYCNVLCSFPLLSYG